MIYTVTLNPCVDKTVTLDSFFEGETNRVKSSEKNICGKGINASVVLGNLGHKNGAFFFEYEDGPSVSAFLSSKGVSPYPTDVKGELRTNVKLHDLRKNLVTEVNEKGGKVSEDNLKAILSSITETLKAGDVVTLSGSVPLGVPSDIYKTLITALKSKGVITVLDASGELLKLGLEAKPDLVKPNRDELSELTGKSIDTAIDAANAAAELVYSGVKNVCVSMGKDGAVFVTKDVCLKAVNRDVDVKGTVGAGDSMVAGFALGLSKGMDEAEMLRIASAMAAGSVSLPSTNLCTPELFAEMYERVEISDLSK